MRIFLLFFIFSLNSFAIEVIRPDFSHKKLILNIIRAYPDSWETYTLVNHNSREMLMVCAKNRIYDDNPKAYIEYRNFLNEKAAHFIINEDKVCKELGRFIEQTHMAIDERRPLQIVLSRKTMQVEKIIYPQVDPLDDRGEYDDLFHKAPIIINKEETKKIEAGTLN